MKKISQIILVVLFIAASIGMASAAPRTWMDIIDWNPDPFVDTKRSLSYTHDITDGEAGITGYLMDDDLIWDYSLTGALYDDNGMGSAPVPEPATILLFGSGLIGLAGVSRKKLGKNSTSAAIVLR